VVEAYTRLQDLSANAMVPTPTSGAVTEAFVAALEAGEHPWASDDVMRLAGRRYAGTELAGALQPLAKRLLEQHAEAIFASFEPLFDRAAKALVEVRDTTGSVADLSKRLRSSPTPSLERAQLAVNVINDITLIWKTFAIASIPPFRYARNYQLLVIADVPPETWWRTRPDAAGRVSAWDAVCAQFPLSLATPATYRQRCQSIDTAREDVLSKIELEDRPSRPEPRRVRSLEVL